LELFGRQNNDAYVYVISEARENLLNLDKDGRISGKQGARLWNGYSWLRIDKKRQVLRQLVEGLEFYQQSYWRSEPFATLLCVVG